MSSFIFTFTHFNSSFVFDTLSGNEKDLQMYTRRKKDIVNLPPPVTSSDLSNVPKHFTPTNSLPISFHKGRHSCTNYHISNFVSNQSLNASYTSFVNSMSYKCSFKPKRGYYPILVEGCHV